MLPARRHSLPASVDALRLKLDSLRWKARLAMLATALLAALAVDEAYNAVGIGIVLLRGPSIYFPPLLLIVLAVLSAYVLRSTRPSAFSRRLDRDFALKDRLSSARLFRRPGAVPAEVAEAQARECLDRVDFAAMRRRFRFRPRLPLLAIAVFGGVILLAWWRHPGLFTPQSFLLRHGMSLYRVMRPDMRSPSRLSGYVPGEEEDGRRPESPASQDRRVGEKAPDKKEEAKKPAAKEDEKPAPSARQKEPEEKDKEKERDKEKRGRQEEKEREARRPKGDLPSARRPLTLYGRGRPSGMNVSQETTAGTSSPVERPDESQAPLFTGVPRQPGQPYLPPIPLLKLKDKRPGEAFVDPDTVYIQPESYREKYRRHITAYFEKLTKLKEEAHGP